MWFICFILITQCAKLAFFPPNGMSFSFHDSQQLENATVRLTGNARRIISCSRVKGHSFFSYHCVTMGLVANIKYSYVFSDAGVVLEGPLSFIMPDAAKRNITIIHIGDMGITNSANVLSQLKLQDNIDMVFHGGDIAYADKADKIGSAPDYISVWKQFSNMTNSITSRFAYHVCPGNHDITCHDYGDEFCPEELRNFSVYRQWFNMPSSVGPNLWYSFDFGPAHFVFINTESDYPNAPSEQNSHLNPKGGGFGDQLSWLEADLRKTQKPWKIVIGHRPFFSGLTWDWPLGVRDHTKNAFGPIFKRYNVDVFLAAHIHAYERYDVIDGTLHILNGAGGNVEGVDKKWASDPKPTPMHRVAGWGFGKFTLSAKTFLWTFFDEHGKDADFVELIK